MNHHDIVERHVVDALTEVAAATRADTDLIERLITNSQPGGPRQMRPRRPYRRPVWLRPMLAAAVVAAVAGGAAVLAGLPDRQLTPSTNMSSISSPAPSPTPTARVTGPSTSVVSPQGNGPFRPLACTVAPPRSWQAAQSSIIRPPGAAATDDTSGLAILATSSTGAVLAFSGAVRPNGEVVLIQPDRSTRVLYRLPASLAGQAALRIGDGRLDAAWAVFDVVLGGGQGAVGAIEAVDLATGDVQILREASKFSAEIVSAPQLLDGHVYWSEVSNTGRGHVYSWDLTARSRSTLDSGAILGPQSVGGAVEWSRNGRLVWRGSPTLPAGFHLTPGKTATLLRDGSTFAWTAWSGTGTAQRLTIYLTGSGMQRPEAIYRPSSASVVPTLLALSGPFVLWDDGTEIRALDTRSGAATTLTGSRPGFTTASAADGVIALNMIGSKGGAQLVLIRTDALGELRC